MNTNTPFTHYTAPAAGPSTPTTANRGGKATKTPATAGSSKRGRKAKQNTGEQHPLAREDTAASPSTPIVQWSQPTTQLSTESQGSTTIHDESQPQAPGAVSHVTPGGILNLSGNLPVLPAGSVQRPPGDEDGDHDGDDELLPAMADDDFNEQSNWNSQSKDNLKVLMDNFSPEQYDRFEAYRRHALPKQAVRKVIQQSLGQQVSQPVAQIVAGFAKVFVGEIVEKAREVQARRGENGPLSPDHLREAYRMYQEETGRVGAARPVRSKKIFVR